MILYLEEPLKDGTAVNVIEEAGKPYYYSTKGDEQDIYLHHGIRLSGAMTRRTLKSFLSPKRHSPFDRCRPPLCRKAA